MSDAERELLLTVARWIADKNPEKPFGSNYVFHLHQCIRDVEAEQKKDAEK